MRHIETNLYMNIWKHLKLIQPRILLSPPGISPLSKLLLPSMWSVKSCINLASSLSLGCTLRKDKTISRIQSAKMPQFSLYCFYPSHYFLCLEVYPNYSLSVCTFFPSNSSQSNTQEDSIRVTLVKPPFRLSNCMKARDLNSQNPESCDPYLWAQSLSFH